MPHSQLQTAMTPCIALAKTHKRAKTGSCQGHGEGCHGDRSEVKDAWIDVQRRQSLIKGINEDDLNPS